MSGDNKVLNLLLTTTMLVTVLIACQRMPENKTNSSNYRSNLKPTENIPVNIATNSIKLLFK